MEQKTVQIRSKKVHIAVKDGDNQIGEIRFNPDDTQIYAKFIKIIQGLTSGQKGIDSVKIEPEELEALDGELTTLEDFENASVLFDKIAKVSDLSAELWNDACAGLDSIFGDGVCNLFTQGDVDPELLTPLIDAVTPYFKKARKGKTDKFRATAQGGVIE